MIQGKRLRVIARYNFIYYQYISMITAKLNDFLIEAFIAEVLKTKNKSSESVCVCVCVCVCV